MGPGRHATKQRGRLRVGTRAPDGGTMSTHWIRQVIRRSWRDDSGQDLLEYALLVSLIVIAAIGAVDTVGGTIKSIFWEIIANAKF